MSIPLKEGNYTLTIGSLTLNIEINLVATRQTRLDKIQAGGRSRIGGYKYITEYRVEVLDSNNNFVESSTFDDKDKYLEFVNSIIGKENGTSVDPSEIVRKLSIKFQKDTGYYVMDSKFNGIVKNKIKITYCVESFRADPNTIKGYFEKIGGECKVADKLKKVRASQCYVVTVFLPLNFKLDESRRMNKKLIRLTESDLHRIVKESVRRVIKESDNNLRELAQRMAEVGSGSLTDEEHELLRNAGYTFNTISGPGYRVTDICINGRRVAKTINGKTKWY